MKRVLIAAYVMQPDEAPRAFLKLMQQFLIMSKVKFIQITLYHDFNL